MAGLRFGRSGRFGRNRRLDRSELTEADAMAEADMVATAVTLATAINAQPADWENIFILLFCFDEILEIEMLIKQGRIASGKFNVQ